MPRILLLDDETQLRELLKEVLSAEGYDVIASGDGNLTRDASVVRDVDVVVTDVMMPNFDGLEVVRSVRRHAPNVKIIAMSGGGRTVSQDFLPVAGKLGADRLLYKPFSPFDLVEEIRQLTASAA